MNNRILIGHPTGNQFFLNAIESFHAAGMLQELWSCLAFPEDSFWDQLSSLPGLGEIKRRNIDAKYRSYLKTRPFKESIRLLLQRSGFSHLTRKESFPFSIDHVFHDFDKQIAKSVAASHTITHLYLYEDGALASFTEAKQKGIKTFYDLPIAYWKESEKLLTVEANRYPDWEPTLIGNRMSDEKKQRKDQEIELADVVICPSEFVRRSIAKHTSFASKVEVVPFGNPVGLIDTNKAELLNSNGKLKVIFAGTMSQRKGLADVFAAMKLLKTSNVELHIIGAPRMGMQFYKDQCPSFVYHATRPHKQLLELMSQCDVFILPSIIEGRAQTQLEALACGLPIIVTANAGAEDMVEEGKTGFLVPTGSPEKIAEKIDLLTGDRELLASMKRGALEKSKQWTWMHYQRTLVSKIDHFHR